MSSRTIRRITAGFAVAALTASLAACSSDDDDTSDETSTDSATDSGGDDAIPTWPESVDVVNRSDSEVRDLTEERAQAVSSGDCDVLVDDLTDALKRISYQAGNEWRDELGENDSGDNDWSAIKVSDEVVDGPAPTDTACQYDIEGMTINGVPKQVVPGEITRLTIGALPEEENTFETNGNFHEPARVTLDDISYAPIAAAGGQVVEDMVGADGDYDASTSEGYEGEGTILGTHLRADTDDSHFRMLTTSIEGNNNSPTTSGWWLKLDGTSEVEDDTIINVPQEASKRIYYGLLAPSKNVFRSTENEDLN